MSGFYQDDDVRLWNEKALNSQSPEEPSEFYDVFDVIYFGAEKYEANGWLEKDNFNLKDNHASMSRHLAEAYMGVDEDHESKLDPLLHLACRALMAYTRKRRGID